MGFFCHCQSGETFNIVTQLADCRNNEGEDLVFRVKREIPGRKSERSRRASRAWIGFGRNFCQDSTREQCIDMRACQLTPPTFMSAERKRVYSLSERGGFPLLEAVWKVQEFDSAAKSDGDGMQHYYEWRNIDCRTDEIRTLHCVCFIIHILRPYALHAFSFLVTLRFYFFCDVTLHNSHTCDLYQWL